MAQAVLVSAVIPTFNRAELVQRAIDSALAQTLPVDEIVVVDDGSTDRTAEILQSRYGERIRYVRQDNGGVSKARNHGMSLARGQYIALLDSDDVWMPEKTRLQTEFLAAHPHIGMVLCDVRRVDVSTDREDILRRRDVLPRDGWVLDDLLIDPALVPASAMFRREVVDDVGGFDASLPTAEDIDFHLRVASRWQIGVVEEALVEAMRGHEGLSAELRTYSDYIRVVEHAVAGCAGQVSDDVRNRALAATYTRNARGMLIRNEWRAARDLATKAWRAAPTAETRRQLLKLASFAARRAVAQLRRR